MALAPVVRGQAALSTIAGRVSLNRENSVSRGSQVRWKIECPVVSSVLRGVQHAPVAKGEGIVSRSLMLLTVSVIPG